MATPYDIYIDATSKRIYYKAHAGDDVVIPFRVRVDIPADDPAGGTLLVWGPDTSIEHSLKTAELVDAAEQWDIEYNGNGYFDLILTDAQTTALGIDTTWYGKVTVVRGDEKVTRASIKLELVSQEDVY